MMLPDLLDQTGDLFASEEAPRWREELCTGAVVLRGYALDCVPQLLAEIDAITQRAPFRHMQTPGGLYMSVAMSNCGEVGWVTDSRGYRYDRLDPLSGEPWPPMPPALRQLAQAAAEEAGYPDFQPDACLINRYAVGARLALHQDKDEHDYRQPIVSVSLGLPAFFLFGGLRRTDKPQRIPLMHGDVVVWGGPARLHYHGVLALKAGVHALLGDCRINLTFRRAR